MFNSLYGNIGRKIKNLAIGMFIVEAIGAIITGLVLAFSEDILFIFISIGGPVAALIFSWFIYAFGELVEDVHSLNNNESKNIKPQKNAKLPVINKPKQNPANKGTGKKARISVDHKDANNTFETLKLTQRGEGYICPVCGTTNYSFSSCTQCDYVPVEVSDNNMVSENEYTDISCPNCGDLISVLDEKTIVCPWCNTKVDIL